MLKNKRMVEWTGTLTGLLGALLLSLNTELSGYGFIFFLLSNIAWICFALRTRSYGLLTQQIGFSATSILGVVRWLG